MRWFPKSKKLECNIFGKRILSFHSDTHLRSYLSSAGWRQLSLLTESSIQWWVTTLTRFDNNRRRSSEDTLHPWKNLRNIFQQNNNHTHQTDVRNGERLSGTLTANRSHELFSELASLVSWQQSHILFKLTSALYSWMTQESPTMNTPQCEWRYASACQTRCLHASPPPVRVFSMLSWLSEGYLHSCV